MRKLLVLTALVTLPSLADAKRARGHGKTHTDPRLAYVEDEPMKPSAAAPERTADGRMDATIRAPEVSRVSSGEATARGASAAPAIRTDETASGDALEELIIRKMRANQASIDVCVKEQIRRQPTSNGSVTLAVVVSDKKVQSVYVASDTIHNIDLDSCLVKAARSWKLQLATVTFHWPVTLSPSASR